jgi:hypothetical protein
MRQAVQPMNHRDEVGVPKPEDPHVTWTRKENEKSSIMCDGMLEKSYTDGRPDRGRDHPFPCMDGLRSRNGVCPGRVGC